MCSCLYLCLFTDLTADTLRVMTVGVVGYGHLGWYLISVPSLWNLGTLEAAEVSLGSSCLAFPSGSSCGEQLSPAPRTVPSGEDPEGGSQLGPTPGLCVEQKPSEAKSLCS